MNAMNPFTTILLPGSPLARVSAQRRSRVRMMVFIVVAVSVLGLTALLIQSCMQAHDGATKASGSGVTADVPVVNRSPVTVSNVESHAPLKAAPVVTREPAPLLTTQGATQKNYCVVKGDTYSKISKANDVSVNALATANPGVDPAKLRIGYVLRIPLAGEKQALPWSQAPAAVAKDK
jgi:LysM repeat protein